jgi:hypothetical protein
MRWSIKLSELDFVIQHRPVSKIGHIDTLSSHVGSVSLGNNLDRENVLREQEQDAFCNKQTPGTYDSRREFFWDEDGPMYRRRSSGNHQLVVPKTLVHEVIRENHSPVYVDHPGIRRTQELISLRFWWPSMRKDIEEYVRRCDPCQRRKDDREYVALLGDVQEPSAPFEVCSMDVTGLI